MSRSSRAILIGGVGAITVVILILAGHISPTKCTVDSSARKPARDVVHGRTLQLDPTSTEPRSKAYSNGTSRAPVLWPKDSDFDANSGDPNLNSLKSDLINTRTPRAWRLRAASRLPSRASESDLIELFNATIAVDDMNAKTEVSLRVLLFTRLLRERDVGELERIVSHIQDPALYRTSKKILDYYVETNRSYVDDFNLALLGPETAASAK